jgi:hypothetical protein
MLFDVNATSRRTVCVTRGGRDEVTPLYRNQPQARNLLENAQTPTRRVHAVLGSFLFCKTL